MSVDQERVIRLPCLRAPRCNGCHRRMRLAGFCPDPNGLSYMFDHFVCDPCSTHVQHVRAIEKASRLGATETRALPFAPPPGKDVAAR